MEEPPGAEPVVWIREDLDEEMTARIVRQISENGWAGLSTWIDGCLSPS